MSCSHVFFIILRFGTFISSLVLETSFLKAAYIQDVTNQIYHSDSQDHQMHEAKVLYMIKGEINGNNLDTVLHILKSYTEI